MIENEIGKPKRKKKISEPEEKSVAKKTAASRKTSEKKIESKETDLAGEAKPVKKTRAAGKSGSQSAEKTTASENTNSSPETIIPADALAETPNIIESIKDVSVSKTKPRKRKPAAKKAVDSSISSPVRKKTEKAKKEKTETLAHVIESEKPVLSKTEESASPKKEESPIFKELAEPKLPVLPAENRARLQMQSPNRIFFYWSVKHNPFETLNRAFSAGGRDASYTLAIKLVNLDNHAEEIYPVEPSGSWWFNVDSNTNYRAEIGFFAQNRPFVRLMYSNRVQTPRSAPSPNRDLSMDFAVTADQFAEVLGASGYAQDAFEVTVAGDDQKAADRATQNAFFKISGSWNLEADMNELRSILFALASKASLESLRDQMSAGLYAQIEAIMRENTERFSAEKILAALQENFEFEDETEELLTPVFGASSINFPRKPRFPKFSPISSLHSVTSR